MPLSSAIAKSFQRPWFVFAFVFAWKITLFVATVQPVPANDSYFYDGAVVNLLNGGGYFNPSLALALPISGTEVFCAYPPAYQVVLWGWMSVFGTSEVAAMALHMVLFGAYLLVLLEIFRRLKTPALWINLAGLFLFVITFQDRPDSLAQLCGVLAVLGWVRSREVPSRALGRGWDWFATVFIVLSLCTSLQLGGVYLCWMWLLAVAAVAVRGEKITWLPLLATVVIPAALVALVKLGYPRLWIGFQEHAAQTPAVTGWHWPRFDEVLKVLRTAPGVCGVVALGVWLWLQNRAQTLKQLASGPALLALGGAAAAAGISLAALIYLSGNFVLGASYLQPLVVGGFLTACGGQLAERGRRQFWIVVFVALATLGGVRAVGMSTWGVACAADVNHSQAMQRVRTALDATPSGRMVTVSAAYLYEAARHKELRAIHSDWLAPGRNPEHLVNLIIKHRPAKLVLTQFDYYRHFEGSVRQLQLQTQLVEVKINNAVQTPVPDASRALQKVVQHISWSPVIVELNWH
jgi:hypothetical protein